MHVHTLGGDFEIPPHMRKILWTSNPKTSATCSTLYSQVVNLVQVSRFVAVCGSSNSGKTAAIQVAADTFRQSSNLSQTCCVSTTTIAVGSMREEQLFGYQSQEKG